MQLMKSTQIFFTEDWLLREAVVRGRFQARGLLTRRRRRQALLAMLPG